jgi:uncharacterized membrane protein
MFSSLPVPPPQPPWEGMHPLVVHFPIALLLFAAVFVALAAIVPRRGWWFSVSALILLIGGTVGASVSVSTGEAARDVVEDGEDAMWDVLQEHEDLTKQATQAFTVLTIVYAFVVILPLVASPLRSLRFALPANLLFLVLLMGANLLLANAAHLGGRLVHQYGVVSAIAEEEAGMVEEEAAEEPMEEESAVDDSAEEADEAMDATAEEPATEEPATEEPAAEEAAAEEAAAEEAEMAAEATAAEGESPASAAEPEPAPTAEAPTETPASAPASESAAPEGSES